MFLERMSVSLDEFLKYLLKKWFLIGLSVVILGVIAAVLAKMNGNAIVISQSEKYVELKEQENGFLDYINNSVIMQMDPMNVYERTVFIDDISNRTELKDYVDSGKIWEKSEEQLSVNYLLELISWEESGNGTSAELLVQHSEEEMCEEFAQYLAQQLQEYDNGVKATVGEQRTIIEQSVSEKQEWYRNRLKDIQGQLEYATAGCIIEVSEVISFGFGALMGGLGAIVALFFVFLLKREV